MNKKVTLAADVALETANTYRLYFGGSVEQWSLDNLEQLCTAIFENEDEPDLIGMPNGLLLRWNPYIANCFVAKGIITRGQFLQACLVQKGGES